MNKKTLILSILILLLTTLLSTNVIAATLTSAAITITSSKTEYESGESVEFTVSLKDLNASSGIMGLGAYIEYNSDLLTLDTSAKGLSGWGETNISSNTNRFAITKDSHSENNEDIVKIKFTAKTVNSNTDTSISLKKIEISNGAEYDINEVSSNTITIKPKTGGSENPPVNPDEPDTPDNPDNPTIPDNPDTPSNPGNTGNTGNETNPEQTGGTTDNPSGSENSNPNNNNDNEPSEGNNNAGNQNDNNSNNTNTNNSNDKGNTSKKQTENKSDTSIPQLGTNGYIAIIIAIVTLVAVLLFIKIKVLDKKIKEKDNFTDKN